jgi:hypothetical protein
MKLCLAAAGLAVLMACSPEHRAEPPSQVPVMRADTSGAADSSNLKGDSTMARDTARR